MLIRGLVAVLIVVAFTVGTAGAGVNKTVSKRTAAPYNVTAIITSNSSTGGSNDEGYKAATAALNKKGGLKGTTPVNATYCFDQGNASVAAQCAQAAVQGGADLIWPSSITEAATVPITDAAGIPEIPGGYGSPGIFSDKLVFQFGENTLSYVSAWAPAMEKLYQCKKVGIVLVSVAVAYSNVKGLQLAFQRLHVATAPIVTVDLTTTDYLPAAERMKQYGADCVVMFTLLNGIVPFITAAHSLGYNPHYSGSLFQTTEQGWTSQPSYATQGYVSRSVLPFGTGVWIDPNTTNALEQHYIRDMAAAGFSSDINNGNNFTSWLTVQAVAALAKTVKGPVTKESMLAAARAATKKHPIKVPGDPVPWAPGAKGPAAVPQVPDGTSFPLVWRNGQWQKVYPKGINMWKLFGWS